MMVFLSRVYNEHSSLEKSFLRTEGGNEANQALVEEVTWLFEIDPRLLRSMPPFSRKPGCRSPLDRKEGRSEK